MSPRNRRAWTRGLLRLGLVLWLGVAGTAALAQQCTRDSACDDGVFCNGLERCRPQSPDSNARGCVAGTPPCATGLSVCIEQELACETNCADGGDQDGDGHVALNCGGDDCDDMDAGVFPGNTEICDPGRKDEDCDRTTIGHRDDDNDGYIDRYCRWGAAG